MRDVIAYAGNPSGSWAVAEINGAVVSCLVSLSDETWLAWQAAGVTLRPWTHKDSPNRPLVLAHFEALVDAKAALARQAVTGTDDPAKLATYDLKASVAAGDDLSGLAGEAAARGMTVDALAALIRSRRDQWKAAALHIDARAAELKAAIRAADDLSAVDLAAGWSLP